MTALSCNINKRFFVPRTACLSGSPIKTIQINDEDIRNFAGWIARYYTRVALPNALVTRAKKMFDIIKKGMKKDRTSGDPLSSHINKIYISWEPDTELTDGLYQVDLLFMCDDANTNSKLYDALEENLQKYTETKGHDGIKLKYENKVISETFLSDIQGYKRLSEWDYLTNLGDLAASEF